MTRDEARTEERERQEFVDALTVEEREEGGHGYTECEKCSAVMAIIENGAAPFCPECDPELEDD